MWHLERTRSPSWRLPWWLGIDMMPPSSPQSTISSSKCGTHPQGSFSIAYLWVQFQGQSQVDVDHSETDLRLNSSPFPWQGFGVEVPSCPCLLGGGCTMGTGADVQDPGDCWEPFEGSICALVSPCSPSLPISAFLSSDTAKPVAGMVPKHSSSKLRCPGWLPDLGCPLSDSQHIWR